ncbi:MAG: UPF0104 family protein [Methanobrevibacter sp.]|jgi:uncharacterized protein (TIRG00374 family)|nr:UPF0104 family protein [Candidatus Methanovirga basalitermitum]
MRYKTGLFFLFGIIVMIIIVYFAGFNELIEKLKIADFKYVLAALIVQITSFFLFAIRWHIINKIANINIKSLKLVPMIIIGLAINNITPSGSAGGEPVKAYILSSKTNSPFESTFATTIADRALDTIPFLILAIITIFTLILFFPPNKEYIAIMVLAVILITTLFIVIIYTSMNKKFAEKTIVLILKVVRKFYKKNHEELEKKIVESITGFQETMKIMLKDKNILYKALPLSFFIWFSEIFRMYLVFLAFGSSINIFVIAEIFIISTLVGMIPLFPGGLGAVELMMMGLLTFAGVPNEISVAVTIIERGISYWLPIFLGFLLLPYYGYSSDEIKNEYKSVDSKIIKKFTNNPELDDIFDNKSKDKTSKKDK